MRIGPYVRLMLPDRQSLIDSMGNHLQALHALQRRDSPAARQAIQQDIFDSAEGLASMLRVREAQDAARPVAAGRSRSGSGAKPPHERR